VQPEVNDPLAQARILEGIDAVDQAQLPAQSGDQIFGPAAPRLEAYQFLPHHLRSVQTVKINASQ
jgi:hypothetical protein